MQSLEDFYSDERRKASREVSFGSLWRSTGAPGFRFSVFWIADTRELCVERTPARDVQQDGAFRRFVLDLPPHFRTNPLRDNEVTVRVIREVGEEELSELMDGWKNQEAAPNGLEWIVSRG